jgi:Protein of unknown function (DUF2735)
MGTHQQSAIILQFPIKGRSSVQNFRDMSKSAEDQRWSKVCAAALDGCWYHDEAVRETDLH